MRVENADRTLHNQPMEIMGPNNIAKGFPKAVKKIKDEAFLDLDFLV